MVDGSDYKTLMKNCYAYVFASTFENLSFALVEAISYGLPIITTTGTSMPETCVEAALYYEPRDTSTLTKHMINIANDKELGMALRKKSLNRAKHFRNIKDDINVNLAIMNDLVG